MVKADEVESEGKYAWVAVVAWLASGEKPGKAEIEQINMSAPTRGKIVQFGERSDVDGMTCGIASVVHGPHRGEKAYFVREEVRAPTKIYVQTFKNN
jgi:hypothetical protein